MKISLKLKAYVKNFMICLLAVLLVAIAPNESNAFGNTSWYGPGFHGRLTANGERFNMHALTAAHKTLPFGTVIRVTNSKNGKSVNVRINDRGPYHGNRYLDLSKAAHLAIDCNLCHTTYEIIKRGDGTTHHHGKTHTPKSKKAIRTKNSKATKRVVKKRWHRVKNKSRHHRR